MLRGQTSSRRSICIRRLVHAGCLSTYMIHTEKWIEIFLRLIIRFGDTGNSAHILVGER